MENLLVWFFFYSKNYMKEKMKEWEVFYFQFNPLGQSYCLWVWHFSRVDSWINPYFSPVFPHFIFYLVFRFFLLHWIKPHRFPFEKPFPKAYKFLNWFFKGLSLIRIHYLVIQWRPVITQLLQSLVAQRLLLELHSSISTFRFLE